MVDKFTKITIVLIILLSIRLIGQIGGAIYFSFDVAMIIGYMFFALLYLLALIGIATLQKWGSIIAIAAAVFDIIGTMIGYGYLEFSQLIAPILGDILIITFAYKEYQRLT